MIPHKIRDISPFLAMEIFEKALKMEREGRRIIHLEFGEPDLPTPLPIIEACNKALKDGKTKYTHSQGLLPLREAISENYLTKYGVEVSPEQILITSGTSPALLAVFLTLLKPGDEVLLPNPHYPCYPNFIKCLDAVPVYIPIFDEEGFQYPLERMEEKLSEKTKAILINSPSNPTGAILNPKSIEALCNLGYPIISDEVYHGLVYDDEEEHTALEFTKNAFVLNGFSKLYAMTGWRLGYVIAPKEFARPMQKMLQNFFISANCFVQWAAIAALRECKEDIERMRRIYDERRKFMVRRLTSLGFGMKTEPKGAFYCFTSIARFAKNSFKFANEMLEEAGVGVTPGIDFGTNGEGYVRFSYANSIENISEAIDRLEKFLEKYGN